MKQDKLLELMFDHNMWQNMIDKANDKGINLTVVKQMCIPQVRVKLYEAIINEQYEIMPPHQIEIPKDDGTMRLVYANEDQDRILCTLINDCVMELFADMIHPSCVSYQKGKGTQEIVQNISKEIVKLNKNKYGETLGFVSDFTKFFDSVTIDKIDDIFNIWESRLGFEYGTEPVINMLRKYYHSTLYFDIDGNLQNKYLSLKQGCALAAALSCMVLYELDDFMSKKYDIYYRYSDDCLTISSDVSNVIDDINSICTKYGTVLNPKKIKPIYYNSWFKFLGFQIKGNMITLSKNRVKKFQKEIVSRTLDKPNITFDQARKNIIDYLYNGEYCWATSCLGTVNCKPDLDEMNKFIMDCLRSCKVRETKKRKSKISISKIGGLGVVTDFPDRTILRGTGKNVTANRNKTDKYIENYLSMGCLSNAMKINKTVYDACVRSM